MNTQRLTRRNVVKAGCALTAGLASPYVITSSAFGSDGTPPASERITVGHIGVGGRGRALFGDVRQVAQAQSVAVADCYRDRREGISAVCKGKAYQDFRELLARDDVDAVVVATPDHWHVPVCQLAAEAGKHVYLEKPVGLTIEQNLACQKLFRKTGLVFQYGTQQRSMPHCFKACELVRRGAVGEIHTIEVDAPNGGAGGSNAGAPVPRGLDYDMWLGPAPPAPYTVDRCKPPGTYWVYDQSIGYLAGWGAHPLDLMVWGSDADLSGPITVEGTGEVGGTGEVEAEGTGEVEGPDTDVPTQGLYNTVRNWDIKLKLGSVRMIFRPGTDRTKFIGSDGWIQVARSRDNTTASTPSLLEAELDSAENHLKVSHHHMGNFIDAVAAGNPRATVTSVEESVRSDIISHLCDIAVRTGETIIWDPIKQAMTGGSDQARAMISRPMRDAWLS